MPFIAVPIALALVACMLVIRIYLKSGMDLDQILKKFDEDKEFKE